MANVLADLGQQMRPYNQYLNRLQSIVTRIEQINPDGRKQQGTLYIKKPGQLRLIYEPMNTIDLIADGRRLIRYDWRTRESESVSLSNTPLNFLLEKNIVLQDQVEVKQIIPGPRWTQIIVQSKDDPEAGQIKLVFQNNPLKLIRWVITDPNGQKTVVTLTDFRTNIAIDPKIFRMRTED